MRTFKKALLSAVSLICVVALLSVIIIEPRKPLEGQYCCDAKLREDLAGSIDYIVLGASHALTAFVPSILDDALGCDSYNLSAVRMPFHAKLYFLEKELRRNPVKHVVLEVSYDVLTPEGGGEYGTGDAVSLARLDSLPEGLAYLMKYVPLDDWLNIYCRELVFGVQFWKAYLFGETDKFLDRAEKGHWARVSEDVTMSEKTAVRTYNQQPLNTDYDGEKIQALTELVALCRRYGADVTIVVCPVADRVIWQQDGWDAFRQWLERFSGENGCVLYDFNLLKTRYDIFSDACSYYDNTHMSNDGALALSAAYTDIVKKAESGEDTSVYFYDTYEEMKADSPYMRYLDKAS